MTLPTSTQAADKAALLKLSQTMVQSCPDMHALARTFAIEVMARHGVTGLDPDKVWWHHWSSSQSNPSTYTGWEHQGVPVESLTLSQLVIRRFNAADQLNADLLHQMGGFYQAGPHAGVFDQRNEVRLDPANVLNDFWVIDFAGTFRAQMATYWATHTEAYRTQAKINYLSKALDDRKAGQLSDVQLHLMFKAVGADKHSPIDVAALQSRTQAPADLNIYAFDIRGHQASDMLRMVDADGRQYVYMPGETEAFHCFENAYDLYFWVLNQTNEAENRTRFMAHFPLTAQGEGDHDSVGLNHTLDLLFRGFGPHAPTVYQNQTPISGDLFDHLAQTARGRMHADADFALHSNADLQKKLWKAYLGAGLSVFGPMAVLGAPAALILLGAGIASLGLSIDQAVNGRTASERMAGLQEILQVIENLFETAVLWGLDSVSASGEVEFKSALESSDLPSSHDPIAVALTPAEIEPLLPRPLQDKPARELLAPFETNELLDGPAPADAQGRMRGIQLNGEGQTFVEIDGLAYQVRYAREMNTWVVIDPQNPYSFYRHVPVRFTEQGEWEVLRKGGLAGGMKLFGKKPWGRGLFGGQAVELTPTFPYDIPPELRTRTEYIANGNGSKALTGEYASVDTFAELQQVLELREKLAADAKEFFIEPKLPARPTLPAIQANASEAEIITSLLEQSPGIVIGESHSSIASKKFLIENMKLLARQRVRTLYMEHLQNDFQQADLDAFARTGEMPEKLETYLKWQDRGHDTDPSGRYTFLALVKAANKYHIRVQAIDCVASYRLDSMPDPKGNLRQTTMNYFADMVISNNQATRGDSKWVALVGNTHTNTFKGIPGVAELEGAIGLRIDDVPAGTSRGIQPDPGLSITEPGGSEDIKMKCDLLYQGETLVENKAAKEMEQRLVRPGMFGIDARTARIVHRSGDNSLVYTPIEKDGGLVFIRRQRWGYVNERRFDGINELAKALQSLGMKWVA